MRTLLVITLIGLLSFCPVLCGAAEVGHDAHGHGASDEPASPTHCPDDGDNCICQGALVSSSGSHVSLLDTLGVALDSVSLGQISSCPLAYLTRDGSPTGLTPWGNALKVRAFLQNFRC
ncbi:MAG: hypothetical protein ABI353_10785 [Isosphaeraceae bacterium]